MYEDGLFKLDVQERILADTNKNEFQLAADPDRLKKEGYDLGIIRKLGNDKKL